METTMGINYELAPELQEQVNELARMLFPHVRIDSVVCLRSFGSSSRGTIARCHALGKAMQLALGRRGFYVIEVINKRFDKMSEEEKTKTLIHELMHIPKSFGGGFIHHNVVHERNVERMYQHYVNLKKHNSFLISKTSNDNPEVSDLKKKEGFVNSILRGEGIDSAREISNNISENMNPKKRNWWF